MKQRNPLRVGAIGAVVATVVCFTPLVLALLGALGLSSWFGFVDSIFHVVFVLSVGLVVYGLYRALRGRREQRV